MIDVKEEDDNLSEWLLEDIQRIQKVAMQHGAKLSLQKAKDLWEDYSYSLAANWMNMDNITDDEIWIIINSDSI